MSHKFLYLIVISVATAGCAGRPTVPPPLAQPAISSVPASPVPAQRSEALLVALLALGIDYQSGGDSPETGFDCSGLVAHVFEEAYGIRLPRTARSQSEAGVPVSADALEPGDLVFYNTLGRPFSHVGIYLGEGRFVHAPKAGSRVRVESLRSGYWTARFNGARRIGPAL